MTDLINQHLEIWTSAIASKASVGRGNKSPSPAGEGRGEGNPTNSRSAKYSAYGIKKLRELILELAVRGKLVTQDPNDEPAKALLDKIFFQKTRLIDEGKLKPQKGLPEISEEEKPHHLPTGWELARLGEIINVINGRAYKKHEMLQEGTPLLRVGNLFTSNEWYYSDLELEPDKYIDNGDLIYAWSASFGPFIWQGGKVIYHYHIWKLDLYDPSCLDKQFLFYFFTSITEKIKASGNGIAMIHMTKERMEKLILEIPPLAEQHRIVAKVEELMALCDQLEQQQTNHVAAHQTLVQTLLDTLIQAADAAEFEQAWSRIADYFDTLFTTASSIDQLKQTLLQLAVMGKLVPHDPADEPASELIKKITAQKVQMVKEGKIKADKPLPPIDDTDKPFELPKGWLWERLPNISFFQEGPGIMAKDFRDVGVPLIRISGVHGPVVSLDGCNFLDEDMVAKKWNHFRLEEGDIILSSSASLGKVSKVGLDAIGSIAYTGLIRFKPYKFVCDDYLIKFLGSSEFVRQIDDSKRGAAIQHFGPTHLRGMIVPIPPLPEQHRIVAKVDELMALCDALKARIAAAQTTQLQLADAIVEQAVA